MFGLKRREFITLLGGAAAWPLAARAQERLRRIGFLLAAYTPTDQPGEARIATFHNALSALGWSEGRNIQFEYYWGEGKLDRIYRRLMGRLLTRPSARLVFFGGVALLLLAAMSLVALKVVTVKMLPFDNKSEFEVLLDLPPGTPLETTLAAADEIGLALVQRPEVENFQIYAGLGAPVTFNGLVRHYDFRQDPRFAEVQVNLVEAQHRKLQSHAIAREVRPMVEEVAARYGARSKVVEVPPGPPVLSTLVAEIYGPDQAGREALAHQVWEVFGSTPGVVDHGLFPPELVAKILVGREDEVERRTL